MAESPSKIQPLLEEIYKLESLEAKIDRQSFEQFVSSLINGDTITKFLVIPATLANKQTAIIAYVLTNAKLIKISIIGRDFNSDNNPYLNQIVSLGKSIVEDGKKAKISIEFQNGNFGLGYPTNSSEIDEFFQSVDQAVKDIRGKNEQKV